MLQIFPLVTPVPSKSLLVLNPQFHTLFVPPLKAFGTREIIKETPPCVFPVQKYL